MQLECTGRKRFPNLSQLRYLKVNVMHKPMNVAQNDFPESVTKYEVDLYVEISQLM